MQLLEFAPSAIAAACVSSDARSSRALTTDTIVCLRDLDTMFALHTAILDRPSVSSDRIIALDTNYRPDRMWKMSAPGSYAQ